MRTIIVVLLLCRALEAQMHPIGKMYDCRTNPADICFDLGTPEPIDVPAITKQVLSWSGNKNCHSPYPACICKLEGNIITCDHGAKCYLVQCEPDDHYVPITTCADKTRILEHDEQEPPKWWCRKVQP